MPAPTAIARYSEPFILLRNSKQPANLLGRIPHAIEPQWDNVWDPRLAGFPVNIVYAAKHRGRWADASNSWDRMLQSGVQLLDRFAQDDRVRIRQPRRNLQVKCTKSLASQNVVSGRMQRNRTTYRERQFIMH